LIAVRTPLRISFFGGGTDIANVYNEIGGAVFSTTINRYIYIFLNFKYDRKGVIAKYSTLEDVPSPRYLSHPIMRSCLSRFNLDGLDISISSDVPAGTGLGSSSAFTVGFIQACTILKDGRIDPEELARIACEIEIDDLNEPIGKQDALAAAYGGLRGYTFDIRGAVKVIESPLSKSHKRQLEDSIYLIRVGNVRKTSELLSAQISPIESKSVLKSYEDLRDLALDAQAMTTFDSSQFGAMLSQAWLLKKRQNPLVTNELVDHVIDLGAKAGASGSKLLGAGQSGFILFIVDATNEERFRYGLKEFKPFKVGIDVPGSNELFNSERKI
jgi:D-glycero-alpha-D-manno-heptose-7-phosphate kinase